MGIVRRSVAHFGTRSKNGSPTNTTVPLISTTSLGANENDSLSPQISTENDFSTSGDEAFGGSKRRGNSSRAASLSPKALLSMMPSGSGGTPKSRGKGRKTYFLSSSPSSSLDSPARHLSSNTEPAASVPSHYSAADTPKMSTRMAAIHARTLAAAEFEERTKEAASESASEDASSGQNGEPPSSALIASLPDRDDATVLMPANTGEAPSPSAGSLSHNWMIDHSAISLGKTIGHSSFGMVNEGRLNGTKVAVKTIKREGKLDEKGEDLEAFKKEAELNCQLRHPNIVLFMGISIQPTEVCIVTELMARGNVHDLLVSPVRGKMVKLAWSRRLQWAIDTAQGMAYLHSLNPPMIHRDLKTTNLLVDRGMNVKICDFGLSRYQADDKIMSAVGTVQFAAPEVLRHEKYTEKADLFSFGTVLWELFTRRTIFEGMPQLGVYKSVVEGDMPEVGEKCDKRYAKLVRDCWNLDGNRRPSFRECLDFLQPLADELEDEEF